MAINPYTGKPYKNKKNIDTDPQEEINEYQQKQASKKTIDNMRKQLLNPGPNNMFNKTTNTTKTNTQDFSDMSVQDLGAKIRADLEDQYIKNIVPDESNKFTRVNYPWKNDGFSKDIDINSIKQLQKINSQPQYDDPYNDPRRVSDYDIEKASKGYTPKPISSGLMPDTPQYAESEIKINPEYEKFVNERKRARDVSGKEGLINLGDNPLVENLYSGILDPLAYEAEKAYKNTWLGRTATQAGETSGFKMINQDGTQVEKSDQGFLGNLSADMIGTILGFKSIPGATGGNLLNATDDIGIFAGEKAAQKLSTATTKAGATFNRIAPEVVRGATDNAMSSAILAVGQGKDLETTAKDTATSAFYGGLFGGLTKGADEFLRQRRMDKVVNNPDFLGYNSKQIGDGTIKPGETAGPKTPDPDTLSVKGAKEKTKFNPLEDPLLLNRADRMKNARRMIGGNDVAEDVVTSPGMIDTKNQYIKGHVTPIDDTTIETEFFEMTPSYRVKRTAKAHQEAQDTTKTNEESNNTTKVDKQLETQINENKGNKVNLEKFGECEIIEEDGGAVKLKNKKGTEFKIGKEAFEKLKIYDTPAPKAAEPPTIKPVEAPDLNYKKKVDYGKTVAEFKHTEAERIEIQKEIKDLENKIEPLKEKVAAERNTGRTDAFNELETVKDKIQELDKERNKIIHTDKPVDPKAKELEDSINKRVEKLGEDLKKNKETESKQQTVDKFNSENNDKTAILTDDNTIVFKDKISVTSNSKPEEIENFMRERFKNKRNGKPDLVLEEIIEASKDGTISKDILKKVIKDFETQEFGEFEYKVPKGTSKEDKEYLKNIRQRVKAAEVMYKHYSDLGYYEKVKNPTLRQMEEAYIPAKKDHDQKKAAQHQKEKSEKEDRHKKQFDKVKNEYRDKVKKDIENGLEYGEILSKYDNDNIEIEGKEHSGSYIVKEILDQDDKELLAKSKGLTIEELDKQIDLEREASKKQNTENMMNITYKSIKRYIERGNSAIYEAENILLYEGKEIPGPLKDELLEKKKRISEWIEAGGYTWGEKAANNYGYTTSELVGNIENPLVRAFENSDIEKMKVTIKEIDRVLELKPQKLEAVETKKDPLKPPPVKTKKSAKAEQEKFINTVLNKKIDREIDRLQETLNKYEEFFNKTKFVPGKVDKAQLEMVIESTSKFFFNDGKGVKKPGSEKTYLTADKLPKDKMDKYFELLDKIKEYYKLDLMPPNVSGMEIQGHKTPEQFREIGGKFLDKKKKAAEVKKTDPPPIKKEVAEAKPKEIKTPDKDYIYPELKLSNEDNEIINSYSGIDLKDIDDTDLPDYYLNENEAPTTELWSKYEDGKPKKKFDPPAITKKGDTKPTKSKWTVETKAPEIKENKFEIINDKDHFTLERVGHDPFVITRGEEVLYYVTRDYQDKKIEYSKGIVEGISQAKREIKVNGHWRNVGSIYPLNYNWLSDPSDEGWTAVDWTENFNNKSKPKPKYEVVVPETKPKKADPTPPPISKKDFTIEKFQETVGKVMRGEDISYNEVLETVKYVTDNKDKVIENLSKMTIKQLKQISGSARMSDGKKDQLVEEAYSDVISSVLNVTGANKESTETYTINFGTGETIANQKAKKLKAALENFTEEKHKENIAFRKEKHEKYLAETAAKRETIKNPKTLEDYNFASKYRKLTPEERRIYEDLKAEKSQTKKVETKIKNETAKIEGTVHYSSEKGGYSITLGKDTRDNRDLWTVKFDEKAGDFKDLNREMKSFSKGAGYSRFTRGFNFYEDPTDKLIEMYGSKLDIQEAPAKAEEIIKQKSDSRIEKLRSLADNLQSEIDDGYRPRSENTTRKADQAESARKYAAYLEEQQKLIRTIADELEAGNIKFLGGITHKTHIEELDRLINRAFYNYVNAAGIEKYPENKSKYGHDANSYSRGQYIADLQKEHKVTNEVPDHIKYPYPYNYKYALINLIDKTKGQNGTKQAISRIEKFLKNQGPDTQKEYDTRPILNDIMKLHDIAKTIDKSYKKSSMDTYKRLQAAGIETIEELRAALRELIMLKGDNSVSKEKLKEMELKSKEKELARRGIKSYFPTPKKIVEDMLDKADIGEGERVLEPSAGAGHIADEIGPGKVDVVEFNMSLHNLLKDKGHNLVGQDFLEYNPGPVYDKIVMNPPFEQNADIIHVMHAWDLLKPGGRIVAITSEHPFFAKDKASTEFREFLDQYGIEYEKLPEGSFKEGDVKTGVNTRLVVIEKPEDIAPVKAADPEPVKAPEEVPEIKIDTEVKAEQKLAEVVNKDYQKLINNQAKASKDIEKHFPDKTKVKSLKADIKKLDKEITKLEKSLLKHRKLETINKIKDLKAERADLKDELNVLSLKFNDKQRELAYNILNAERLSDFEIPPGNKFGMSPIMKFDFVDYSLRTYNNAAETDEVIKFSVPNDGDFEVPNDIGALTLLYDRLGITVKSPAQKAGTKIGDISTKFYENREVSSKWISEPHNIELMDVHGKKSTVTVDGKVNGGLMIHKEVIPTNSGTKISYPVTHIKSGISLVGSFKTEAQAKAFANEVLKRFDFTGDTENVTNVFKENIETFRELRELVVADSKEYSEKLIQLDKELKERQPEFKINLKLNAGRGINERMRGVDFKGYEKKSVKRTRTTVAPPPIKKVHQTTFEEEIKKNPPKAVKVDHKDRLSSAQPDTSNVKPKVKTSKVKTNTWTNSEFMSEQWVQDVVTDVNADYLEKPNQQSFERAVNILKHDYDGTVAKLMNITKNHRATFKGKIPARAKIKNIFDQDQPDIIPMTAEDVAASMVITRDLINSGDSEKLADFLGSFRPNITNAGQVIQAMAMYKKLTPEGTLMRAAADVDKYFNDVIKDQPHVINDANKTASDIADKMKEVNKEVVEDVVKGVEDTLDDIVTDPTGDTDTVIVTSPPPKPAAPETPKAAPEPVKGPEELTPEQKQKVKDKLKPPKVKKERKPKAAGGGMVTPPEEISLEEKLAKRIKSYALSKPKRMEHDDKLLKSLFNVAKDEIDPLYMKQFTSPQEFVRHAIKFREQYNEIWVKAKEIISEEYKDDEEIAALFEEYFNKKLVPVFYEKDLNKAIKLKMKERGLNLNELVKQHYIYNKGAENYLVNTLTYGYDFTEEQANYLERYIRKEFKRLTVEKKEKILSNMFKEKGPIKRQETGPIKRIMELSNLGVYNSEKYAKMVYEKKGLPVLTPDDVLFINNNMLKYMTEKDPEMKEIWMGQITRRIGNKQAATTRSKALGLLRISLLGNLKTLITKNAGGNLGLMLGENLKDYPASIIDYMISERFDTLRTTAAPNLQTLKEQAINLHDGVRRVFKDVKYNSDTNPARGRYEIPQGYSFQGNKILGPLEKGVNIGLTLGDRPFYQSGHAATIEQLQRLHGEELPDHMKDFAHNVGKERTYQNESTLNQAMKFIKTGMNKPLQISPIRAGDLALTYTQTMSNIVDKRIDYSGIGGLLRGAAELSSFARDIKNNTVMDEAEIMQRQKSIVDRLGRGIVGAVIFGTGIVGGLYGLVTGGEDDKDKIKDLEKSQGIQSNSVKIGKNYHSIDWLESIGVPLLLGADVAQKDKRGYSDYDLIVNAGENIISGDLFYGIKRLMGQYSDGFVDGMIKSVIELPSMFVPTAVKQIAQMVDGTSRSTKGENVLETTLNKVLNKIPYASKTLPPNVDIWGNDVKLYDGENNTLNVMLNPSYVSKEKEDKASMLAMAIFNEEGNTDVLPKYAPNKRTVTDITKERHEIVLTAEERIEWQRIIGQGVAKAYSDLYDDKLFQNLDNEAKEEKMKDIIAEWDKKALQNLCNSRDIVLKPKK